MTSERSRLLTPAETCGITGDEAPLTADDIDRLARRFYTPERAADAITGRHPDWARPSPAGGAGGGRRYTTDRRGIWVRIHGDPPRAGHVPWRDLEAVLTRHATPVTVRALVAAADAHRQHLGAWHDAANDPWRKGPVPYDTETGARLAATARDALDALLAPASEQGALFDLETTR